MGLTAHLWHANVILAILRYPWPLHYRGIENFEKSSTMGSTRSRVGVACDFLERSWVGLSSSTVGKRDGLQVKAIEIRVRVFRQDDVSVGSVGGALLSGCASALPCYGSSITLLLVTATSYRVMRKHCAGVGCTE
eukprot:TRINITY_DN389_c0_g1_i1.p1 TRINITY_DN389_c0_g1~~TRINITY_DN389_c0_g1_i1.p1  ORF type:complete len:135 (+),score=5.23 TRINITY_DN389_c0_g1_i1:380-784(+)